MKKYLFITIFLFGCAAKPLLPGAEIVLLSNEKPKETCKYLGEVTGGQGNWWTDDITSNKNLVEGSRNDMKNRAFQMQGNYVHIQQISKSSSYMGGGTMGMVGHVYSCPQIP